MIRVLILLTLSFNCLAMNLSDAGRCMEDPSNRALQERFEEFNQAYVKLAEYVPPFNLQVYMTNFLNERTVSDEVRTCADLEKIYAEGTEHMQEILYTQCEFK